MANPSMTTSEQLTLSGRLRRELRNPSMITVILIVVAIAAIPLVILVPSWVDTARGSFDAQNRADRLRDASLLSADVVVPSQITPWMLNQITYMEKAETPAEWRRTSFIEGPCHRSNLVQLPAGQYTDAINSSCTDMQQIQSQYASDCRTAQSCEISAAALDRLAIVRADLLEAFSEAGFVLPYNDEEEQVGP